LGARGHSMVVQLAYASGMRALYLIVTIAALGS
jgi:hypothetical protein